MGRGTLCRECDENDGSNLKFGTRGRRATYRDFGPRKSVIHIRFPFSPSQMISSGFCRVHPQNQREKQLFFVALIRLATMYAKIRDGSRGHCFRRDIYSAWSSSGSEVPSWYTGEHTHVQQQPSSRQPAVVYSLPVAFTRGRTSARPLSSDRELRTPKQTRSPSAEWE
jgi:hypothetical protein